MRYVSSILPHCYHTKNKKSTTITDKTPAPFELILSYLDITIKRGKTKNYILKTTVSITHRVRLIVGVRLTRVVHVLGMITYRSRASIGEWPRIQRDLLSPLKSIR